MTAPPLFTDVRQVCTVVDDFETTVRHLVEHLGIGPFRCWHMRPPRLYGTTYRQKPAVYSMKLGITWLEDIQYEVIQPVDDPTMYRDHLKAHGSGIQHLIMATGDVRWEDAARHLAERGHPFGQTAKLNAKVQIGRWTLPSTPNWLAGPMSLQFGYVDAEATLRTNIELTRYPLGLSERFCLRGGKAEFCVPEANGRFETPLPNRRVGRVVKVTIVTRDLDATIRSYLDLAGVGPWHVHELGADRLSHVLVGGAPPTFRLRLAWSVIGQEVIELVQPLDEQGPYHEALARRGECAATVAFLPGPDGFDKLAAHCGSLGYTPVMEGALAGRHPSLWLRARPWLGTDIEIVDTQGEELAAVYSRAPADRVISR